MKIVVTNNPAPNKPIEQWSNKQILLYYSNRMYERYGQELKIPNVAWAAFVGRVKGFREKLGLSSVQYKQFIDDIFDSGIFKSRTFCPSFGCIVSIRVYRMVNDYKENQGNMSQEYWENLATSLESNNMLFKRVSELLGKKETH